MKNEANQEPPKPRRQIRKRAAKPGKKNPKYCEHSTGKAFVWEGRHPVYFPGVYGSPESHRAYADYCLKLQGSSAISVEPARLTLSMLFSRFAADRLPKLPTSEQQHYSTIISILSPIFAGEPAQEFGPLKLQAAREVFSKQIVQSGKSRSHLGQTAPKQPRRAPKPPAAPKPWSRTHVNAMTKRLTRLFKWAVSAEMFPAEKWLAMKAVEPLKVGETEARETEAIRPVEEDQYEAARKVASPAVAAMMGIHWLTGARSSNICDMRSIDIDQTGDVWTYIPARHKTSWKKRNLIIALGPQAQALLAPFLVRKQPDEYLFSPRESAEWKSEQRWQARKTPKWDSALKRRGKSNQRIGVKYTKWTYRQAIHYAAKNAGVPAFNPHQLRHSLGTRVRKTFGVEAAQVSLGHAALSATEIYSERDMDLARKVAREMG